MTCQVILGLLQSSGAWVAHSRRARTKGVCHFLGGAFAGAAPQVAYNLFIALIADAGYTVISTPYAVTFKHADCARLVRQQFLDAVSELRTTGRRYLAPEAAPTIGMGHSNGALLHLLIGCLFDRPSDANVIVSYNNK